MIDVFKKTALGGIGAGLVAKDKLENLLQDLERKGNLSGDEAREAFDKISRESREEYAQAEEKMSAWFSGLLKEARLATSDDIARLQARIEALEQQLSDPARQP